jgi:hypothetical protein
MMESDQQILGSARASRAGDDALVIAKLITKRVFLAQVRCGEGAATSTRGRVRSPEEIRADRSLLGHPFHTGWPYE